MSQVTAVKQEASGESSDESESLDDEAMMQWALGCLQRTQYLSDSESDDDDDDDDDKKKDTYAPARVSWKNIGTVLSQLASPETQESSTTGNPAARLMPVSASTAVDPLAVTIKEEPPPSPSVAVQQEDSAFKCMKVCGGDAVLPKTECCGTSPPHADIDAFDEPIEDPLEERLSACSESVAVSPPVDPCALTIVDVFSLLSEDSTEESAFRPMDWCDGDSAIPKTECSTTPPPHADMDAVDELFEEPLEENASVCPLPVAVSLPVDSSPVTISHEPPCSPSSSTQCAEEPIEDRAFEPVDWRGGDAVAPKTECAPTSQPSTNIESLSQTIFDYPIESPLEDSRVPSDTNIQVKDHTLRSKEPMKVSIGVDCAVQYKVPWHSGHTSLTKVCEPFKTPLGQDGSADLQKENDTLKNEERMEVNAGFECEWEDASVENKVSYDPDLQKGVETLRTKELPGEAKTLFPVLTDYVPSDARISNSAMNVATEDDSTKQRSGIGDSTRVNAMKDNTDSDTTTTDSTVAHAAPRDSVIMGPSLPLMNEGVCVKCFKHFSTLVKHFMCSSGCAVGTGRGSASLDISWEGGAEVMCSMCDTACLGHWVIVKHIIARWIHECRCCKKRYTYKGELNNHEMVCTTGSQDLAASCVLCVGSRSVLNSLLHPILFNMHLICLLCGQQFISFFNLGVYLHLNRLKCFNIHIRGFSCIRCGFLVKEKKSLNAHMKIHGYVSLQPRHATIQPRFAPIQWTVAPNRKTVAHNQLTVAPNQQTVAPNQQTVAPNQQTVAPNQQTVATNEQTAAPVQQTAALVWQTVAPVQQTAAPVQQTAPPVQQTVAPVRQTAAPVWQTVSHVWQIVTPVCQTVAPVRQTAPPVRLAVASVHQTAAPVCPTATPVRQMAPHVWQMDAPVPQTALPVRQTAAPVWQKAAPVPQAAAPVPQTVTPVPQTVAPVPQTVAPVPQRDAPVPQRNAPVPQRDAPVPQRDAPVPQTAAPIRQTAAPIRQIVAPIRLAVAPIRPAVPPTQQTFAPFLQTFAPIQQTFAPIQQTFAPIQQTFAPIQQTFAPIQQTFAPIQQTFAPIQQTFAPIQQTFAPIQQTFAPIQQTFAPIQQTFAPIQQTFAPIQQTFAPIQQTFAPIQSRSAPVQPRGMPVQPKGPPVRQTVVPVRQTVAPVQQTVVPVRQTVAPVQQTVAPVQQTVAAVRQTVAPVRETVATVLPTVAAGDPKLGASFGVVESGGRKRAASGELTIDRVARVNPRKDNSMTDDST